MPIQPQTYEEFSTLIEENFRNKYGTEVSFQLSNVKVQILQTLWSAGDQWPRGWIRSDALLKLTGQKYFDRRIRELRDETGCDIETGSESGLPAYRLKSIELRPVQDRSYLSARQKKLLLEKYNYICSACGRLFESNQRGLEADHRVPLMRGGGSEIENWQPLCINCNVSKRRSCQGCLEDCTKCAWAYPEKYGMLITIRAPKVLLENLRALAAKQNLHSQDFLVNLIEEAVRKKDSEP